MRFERILMWTAAGLVLLCLSCGDDNGGSVTGPIEEPPRPPVDLRVSETSPSAISISWRDHSTDEIGFRIQRSTGSAASFAERDTVPRDISTYTDNQVDAGQTYYYRVQSYGRFSASNYTDHVWAIAVTNSTPSTPADPTPGDRTEDLEAGLIELTWTATDADAGEVLSYDVYFGQMRNEMTVIGDGVTATTLTPPDPIELNSAYFWQVIVRDSKGAMGIGPVWQFYTRVERLEVPEGWLVMGDEVVFPHPGNPVWVDAFEIDRFEVTNQQFAVYLNDAIRLDPPAIRTSGGEVYSPDGRILYAQTNERDDDSQISYELADSLFIVIPGKENFPVLEVTWQGAVTYAEFYGRRLPTEAEWEMAAKGNDTQYGTRNFTIVEPDTQYVVTVGIGRTYPWGDQLTGQHANYLGSGDPFEGQGRVATTPVGFFNGQERGGFQTFDGSSALGIHDLSGNVAEWCADWYREYTSPHMPPDEGTLRIIRGASWSKGSGSLETWRRDYARPYSLGDDSGADRSIGFRTVISSP